MSRLNRFNVLAASVVVSALGAAGAVQAAGNPFTATDLAGGYQQLADNYAEGKCGEGKCGEGKCGGRHDKANASEGKCGEGRCGEGMCGADMHNAATKPAEKGAEGACGASKAVEGKCGDMGKKP